MMFGMCYIHDIFVSDGDCPKCLQEYNQCIAAGLYPRGLNPAARRCFDLHAWRCLRMIDKGYSIHERDKAEVDRIAPLELPKQSFIGRIFFPRSVEERHRLENELLEKRKEAGKPLLLQSEKQAQAEIREVVERVNQVEKEREENERKAAGTNVSKEYKWL